MCKKDVIGVLKKAAHNDRFIAELTYHPTEVLKKYNLTKDERIALLTGDIQWLETYMGKLNEESVEEFIEVLQVIKDKVKKFLIIEHNHEISPDYIINVSRTSNGISSAVVE